MCLPWYNTFNNLSFKPVGWLVMSKCICAFWINCSISSAVGLVTKLTLCFFSAKLRNLSVGLLPATQSISQMLNDMRSC